jgi:hypothetical protein
VFGLAVIFAGSARADDFLHNLGKAAGDAVHGAGQVVAAVVSGTGQVAGQVVSGVGQGVGQVVSVVSPNTGSEVSDGARRLGNNISQGIGAIGSGAEHVSGEIGKQVAENPVGVLIAIIYPPSAPFVLGAPTIGQAILCAASEHWKKSESCDVDGTISSLSKLPVATLGEIDTDIAPLTTLFKCMSIFGWLNTGCEAVGRGHPARDAQHSDDGFWTIDLALDDLQIQGKHAPAGRYLRLEIRPQRPAHGVALAHFFRPADQICFGGPVLIDKGEWLEVHPIADFGICPPNAAKPTAAPVSPKDEPVVASLQTPSPSNSKAPTENTHVVQLGECLSRIAEEYYGKQDWPRLYRANRRKIKNPDLIYPNQTLVVPPF